VTPSWQLAVKHTVNAWQFLRSAIARHAGVQVGCSGQRLADGTALAELRQVCAQFDAQPLKT
jgi:hypothetical protein